MWNTNKEIGLTSWCIGRGKRKKHEVDYTIFLDERLPKNDEALEEKMQKEAEYLESIKRSSDTSAYVSSGLSVLCSKAQSWPLDNMTGCTSIGRWQN